MLECVLKDLDVKKDANVDFLIEKHLPFIIKCISDTTGRYVSCENDEEISIGMLAFDEAIQRFDNDKGHFLSFAKLVISSRIKNYLKSNNRHKHSSIDDLYEKGMDIKDEVIERKEENFDLAYEIERFKTELNKFSISLDELVQEAPKQQATRINAINLSHKITKNEDLVSFIYNKKRLPITKIVKRFDVTEKVVKRSKKFIISVVIIIDKDFSMLKNWIRK